LQIYFLFAIFIVFLTLLMDFNHEKMAS